ncbi:MAG TPA: hypothetical protein VGH90_09120 [Chthoniobacteraceae bacterium]
MSIEAHVVPFWKAQRLIPAIICLGYAVYFFFDGAVGYPRSNNHWLKHQEYVEAHDLQGWLAYAKEHGWNPNPPEKFHNPADLRGQFVFGGGLVVVGLAFFFYWFTQKDRMMSADDEAVVTPTGARVPYDAVISIDRRKWETKGLARVRYDLEGKKGDFMIDDAKFDPDASHEIFERIEERFLAREDATPDGAG